MDSWRTETQRGLTIVVIEGELTSPIDGTEEPVPFETSFRAEMLPGITDYCLSYKPWDLLVAADGQFARDNGQCLIEALRIGWCAPTPFREAAVEFIALVRHCDHNDVTANEPQPILSFEGADIPVLRSLVSSLATPPRHLRMV